MQCVAGSCYPKASFIRRMCKYDRGAGKRCFRAAVHQASNICTDIDNR
jgi:hypothetical protein